ncbi:MAG: asparagine synthase (glutamine-hydrolyzing) [Acidimicrobiales bacterium]
MCGINGLFAIEGSGNEITVEELVRARDTLSHRGPDGQGVWLSSTQRVGLAHRRLAIIDPDSRAAQPMEGPAGLRVVFNGEIYNHAELRSELVRAGVGPWRTDHSDTEVLLHAFSYWGISCLDHFRGMFAFALWDASRSQLWLVRDRLGIKPLYWTRHRGRLAFASEIKALLADPTVPRQVDHRAMFHYLSFLTTPAPSTLFAGIHKMEAGTWMRVNPDGSAKTHRWWDAWDHTRPLEGIADREIAELVIDELRQSVSYRKVSDVPVGVFLSGGVDSSTNVALFSEGENRPVRTFSVGYCGDHQTYRNELHHARRMATVVGAEHHEVLLDIEDLVDFLPEMVRLQDEPLADPVCVPVHFVARLARQHGVAVAQVGEGADELFCGYPWWRTALRLQGWNDRLGPPAMKRLGARALIALGRGNDHRQEWLARGASRRPLFWSGAEAFTDAAKRRLLHPDVDRELAGLSSWDPLAPIRRRFVDTAWDPSDLHWMTYSDLRLRLPELLLMRVDKMTMGVGLEARVPFLDHRLVELALSIPTDVKLRGGGTKPVLKNAVRGLIPDDLIDRPKQGFGVPVHEYLAGRLGDLARHELKRFCDRSGLLNTEAVMAVVASDRAAETWYLLNLALWWKEWIE